MGNYLRQAYEEAEVRKEKDLEIEKLKDNIKSLCDIVLKLEPRYDQWIEKNIGKEYLNNNG